MTDSTTLEFRLEEASKIKKKYPDKIPVIISKSEMCKSLEKINRNKYLIPHDLLVGQLMYIVKKKISLEPHKAIFLFCNNNIISTSTTVGEIYNKNQNQDGFLYVEYTSENTFG